MLELRQGDEWMGFPNGILNVMHLLGCQSDWVIRRPFGELRRECKIECGLECGLKIQLCTPLMSMIVWVGRGFVGASSWADHFLWWRPFVTLVGSLTLAEPTGQDIQLVGLRSARQARRIARPEHWQGMKLSECEKPEVTCGHEIYGLKYFPIKQVFYDKIFRQCIIYDIYNIYLSYILQHFIIIQYYHVII